MDLKTLLDGLPERKQLITGRAEIRFEEPIGAIGGCAELDLFSEKRPRIRVRIETFAAEPPYNQSVVAFLAGTALPENQGRISFAIGGIERRFVSLVIQTDLGEFSASTGIIWPDSYMGQVEFATATIADLTFTPPTAHHPRYWLAALIGPFTELKLNAEANHTLALPGYGIHFFEERTRKCGLQPLGPEKTECEFELDAIAFGDLSQGITSTDPSEIIPHGILVAISFALGAEIQMPFLETRDLDGNLVRRFFLSSEKRAEAPKGEVFSLIHGAGPGSGIGAFLSSFFSTPDALREQVIVVMNLVRSGAPGNRPIEGSITDLFRALDTLVKATGFAQQQLLQCLNPENARRIEAVVQTTRNQIRTIRESMLMTADLIELAVVDRIAERLREVATKDRHFGIAVGMLLKHLDLLDAEVLRRYCTCSGRTYEQLLSAVRGQVIHEGQLGKMDRRELRAWFEFARHLHDLCKRIILKLVGYEGTYQASTALWRGDFTLSRISADMQLSDLGFSSGLPTFQPRPNATTIEKGSGL